MLRRMPFIVFLVPPLDSTHYTPVATTLPRNSQPMTPTLPNALWGQYHLQLKKIALLFSMNESLLLGRALSGPNMPQELRSRLPLPASTAGLTELVASASFTDCHLLQVHFGAMEMLPLFLFSSLSYLSITVVFEAEGEY